MERTSSSCHREFCGIIGGIGPEATNYLFSLIIRFSGAKKDQDHIPLLIFNNPLIPDRTGYLVAGKESPLPELVRTAMVLKAAGASFLAMPCNTSHAFIAEIEAEVNIEILDMIQLTAKHIISHYGKDITIGLLATDGTLESMIYQDKFSKFALKTDILVPNKEGQTRVMEAIYGETGIKASFCDEHNATLLKNEAETLVRRGAKLIIEGCTEIPLVLSQKLCSFPVVDPMEILAKEILRRTLLN